MKLFAECQIQRSKLHIVVVHRLDPPSQLGHRVARVGAHTHTGTPTSPDALLCTAAGVHAARPGGSAQAGSAQAGGAQAGGAHANAQLTPTAAIGTGGRGQIEMLLVESGGKLSFNGRGGAEAIVCNAEGLILICGLL